MNILLTDYTVPITILRDNFGKLGSRLFEELLHSPCCGGVYIHAVESYVTLKYCAQMGGRFFSYRGVPLGASRLILSLIKKK